MTNPEPEQCQCGCELQIELIIGPIEPCSEELPEPLAGLIRDIQKQNQHQN